MSNNYEVNKNEYQNFSEEAYKDYQVGMNTSIDKWVALSINNEENYGVKIIELSFLY